MDTTESNKGKHTSGVVGTRVFENPWPVTNTNQHINSQQPSSPAISGGPIFVSHTDNREKMASTSLQEKTPTGVGITRFAGDQRLNNTFFPPGPQKGYYRKYPLPGIQNTNIKPRYTRSVSGLRKDPSKEPPELITHPTSFFEQQCVKKDRDKLAVTNSDRLENENLREDSDLDEDGGVVLASSLAVFMQSPGNVKLPVRSIVPKAGAVDRQQEPREFEPEREEVGYRDQQQRKTEQLVSPREEQEEPKTEVIKKPLPKPRSSMASQMAALLQTPGALKFVSRRPSTPVLTANFPTPVYHAGSVGQRREKGKDEEEEEEEEEEEDEKQEEKRNEGWEKLQRWNEEDDKGKKREEAYERKIEELTHAGTQNIFDEPHPNTKLFDFQAGKFKDLDTTRYWRTPNTSFVYARPESPPTTAQKEPNLPRPERRVFRHLKDGDIVGDEAFELPKANKGRLMMEKMGYKEGTPLGNGDGGLIEPVKVEVRLGNRGLGLAKQDPGLPTHASTSQVNSSQMTPTHMIPAGMSGMNGMGRGGNFQQLSYGVTQQLQQMNIATLQQAVGYSLVTPLGAYQTRLRIAQILSYLDALELLDIVDYNHILAAGMNRFAEYQIQSRLGFLMETELVQIITREYKKAILRKDQRGRGNTASSYGVMDRGGYW